MPAQSLYDIDLNILNCLLPKTNMGSTAQELYGTAHSFSVLENRGQRIEDREARNFQGNTNSSQQVTFLTSNF